MRRVFFPVCAGFLIAGFAGCRDSELEKKLEYKKQTAQIYAHRARRFDELRVAMKKKEKELDEEIARLEKENEELRRRAGEKKE